jgi:hypothetical protein
MDTVRMTMCSIQPRSLPRSLTGINADRHDDMICFKPFRQATFYDVFKIETYIFVAFSIFVLFVWKQRLTKRTIFFFVW